MMAALVVTDRLTKDYGAFRALDSLSLEIARGEIMGLLGPNGSGKSTALRLLLGFLQPTSGQASIAGHDCWRESVAVRRRLTYLPGELRLYENMTGRELIGFLTQLRGQAERVEGIGPLARQFDIDLERPLVQLSSGMKRKVALLTVLAPAVDLLILDEPTNTLDPTMRDQLLEQLRHAKQRGQTVLFSSHVLGEVERVCDRVAILRQGRLVHLQNMAELAEGKVVQARFTQPPAGLPDLPGLSLKSEIDHEVLLEYQGPLPPFLDWLAKQAVADVRIEPLGLGPIYQRFHGANG